MHRVGKGHTSSHICLNWSFWSYRVQWNHTIPSLFSRIPCILALCWTSYTLILLHSTHYFIGTGALNSNLKVTAKKHHINFDSSVLKEQYMLWWAFCFFMNLSIFRLLFNWLWEIFFSVNMQSAHFLPAFQILLIFLTPRRNIGSLGAFNTSFQ